MLTIVPVCNAFDVAQDALRRMSLLAARPNILAIDNGSSARLAECEWADPARDTMIPGLQVVRNGTNTGNYPIFAQGLRIAQKAGADVVAFLHSDLIVHQQGWDAQVEQWFATNPRLGLLGFVGSMEIDGSGGRGLGTLSNFQGILGGGAAEVHGARLSSGIMPAAIVDGCAMVFRRACLEACAVWPDFPPHHFYDRLLSCQALEAGWHVAVGSIAVDHLGGRTSVLVPQWNQTAMEWCVAHGIAQPADGGWDLAVYREAERQFLSYYRDAKRFVPCRVWPDWRLEHTT